MTQTTQGWFDMHGWQMGAIMLVLKGKVMAEHWTSCHPNSTIPKSKCAQRGIVQCFFTVIGTKYFAVNLLLVGTYLEGLYTMFICDYLPSLPPIPMYLQTPLVKY